MVRRCRACLVDYEHTSSACQASPLALVPSHWLDTRETVRRTPDTVTDRGGLTKRGHGAYSHFSATAPERVELFTQLSKSDNVEQSGEAVKPPDKHHKMNTDIRTTEFNVLHMEVETLRWQLAQTEANRQMHIALLKQIVTFLNRVKQHFEGQRDEEVTRKNVPSRALARSLNFNDIPRSRSVLHVNKNIEYAITPTKKMSTRKISKSICNVNGYKDCNSHWNKSKLSLVSEHETSIKISEEMSRLITLANTVLSTKLPDLACTCVDKVNDSEARSVDSGVERPLSLNLSTLTISFEKEELRNSIVDDLRPYNGVTDKLVQHDGPNCDKRSASPPANPSELKQTPVDIDILDGEPKRGKGSPNTKVSLAIDKLNDYNAVSNFVEDESGFSSMSSFQEIGIPIISIIPPSPSKEIGCLENSTVSEGTEKWKADAIELDKHSVRVFWV
ncbi:unnamed protein product, partial [Iphiclides podalirius]